LVLPHPLDLFSLVTPKSLFLAQKRRIMGNPEDVVTPFDDPGAPAPVPPPAEPLVTPDAEDPGAPAPVPPPDEE